MPIWALKSRNFEKVYKIKVKIRTILHIISKAHMHWLLVVGAILPLKSVAILSCHPVCRPSSILYIWKKVCPLFYQYSTGISSQKLGLPSKASPFSVNLSQWNSYKKNISTLLWAFHWVNFTEIGPAFLSWPNFCELISVKHLQKGSPSTLLWSFHWESHTEKGPAGLQKYIFYFTNFSNKNKIQPNFIWLWQLSRLK